ncbi:MAG: SDR family NAD(P)-dependent oxidoreductase [Deltaproteobacteria bacterium]|nr:SDR family NAD(P)-dependent oxidoreductase [Deltaproteobacteria bacterium]
MRWSIAGKHCLITGASSGHGRALARALARQGARLCLLGRDRERLEAARAECAAESRAGHEPDCVQCDLASMAAIARTADELLARDRPLHLLVHNAGIVARQRSLTADGIERTLAVNYLAAFQLSLLLLERLQDSAPARIVLVASDAHRVVRLDLDDLQLTRGYSWWKAYGRSKLALLHFNRELARRLAGTGVSVNAVDPGPVASRIAAAEPGLLPRLASTLIQKLFPSPARACRTTVSLCSSAHLQGRSGGYYRFARLRAARLDEDKRTPERLWKASAELTGLDLA